MIITDSSVQLSSQRFSVEEYQRKESLRYWETDNSPRSSDKNAEKSAKSATNMTLSESSVKVSLSSESIEKSSMENLEKVEEQEVMADLNIRILRALIERLTGKKIKFHKPGIGNGGITPASEHSSSKNKDTENATSSAGFGLEYDLHESYYEAEATSFHASGKVVTEDGKEIDFSLDLNMSREFYQENNVSIRMGDALKDPLVINFGGNAAQLTSTKFSFDIDSDGQSDTISFVTPESGFLVLDKNKDGIINDGSELFGAMTGNGFEELAVFDEDENGWIDEGDDIYSRLQIWSKDKDGNDQLLAVGEKGVGAIYLGNASTLFEIKDESNEKLGQVSSSGVYLREDYSVGSVQQLDLVV